MTKKRSFFERLTGTSRSVNNNLEELEEAENTFPKEDPSLAEDTEEGELAIDVFQNDNEIIIKTMVAGVKPDDLDISITRDMVTIKGKREIEITIDESDFFHRELYWGTFSRTIVLPQEVDVEESEAIEKHGLLIIRLPKLNKHRQTRLKVKAN